MQASATLSLREQLSLSRFTRGRPDPAVVTLNRQRIYILPTRAGLGFVAMLALMLIGAINYQLSIGYACTFLLGSLAIVSILHAYRNLAGLRIAAGRTEPVFAGRDARFAIQVTGSDREHQDLVFSLQQAEAIQISVAAHQSQTLHLTRQTIRRGELPIGRLTISTRYPLGLFRAWSHVNLPLTCLVYPRPAADRPAPMQHSYKPSASGDKGRGVDDFAGLRPYRGGDNLRHVYWKGLARSQTLLTKQFGGDRSDEWWLDYVDLPGMVAEARLSILCAWILQASQAQQRYGLRLPGQVIALNSGHAHDHLCLSALARFDDRRRHV